MNWHRTTSIGFCNLTSPPQKTSAVQYEYILCINAETIDFEFNEKMNKKFKNRIKLPSKMAELATPPQIELYSFFLNFKAKTNDNK